MTLIKKEVIIKNKLGLHARPAATFVQAANKFESEITLKKASQEVNGKSIMGIMMLAAKKGSKVLVVAYGPDAEKAVEELSGLLMSEEELKPKGNK